MLPDIDNINTGFAIKRDKRARLRTTGGKLNEVQTVFEHGEGVG